MARTKSRAARGAGRSADCLRVIGLYGILPPTLCRFGAGQVFHASIRCAGNGFYRVAKAACAPKRFRSQGWFGTLGLRWARRAGYGAGGPGFFLGVAAAFGRTTSPSGAFANPFRRYRL